MKESITTMIVQWKCELSKVINKRAEKRTPREVYYQEKLTVNKREPNKRLFVSFSDYSRQLVCN